MQGVQQRLNWLGQTVTMGCDGLGDGVGVNLQCIQLKEWRVGREHDPHPRGLKKNLAQRFLSVLTSSTHIEWIFESRSSCVGCAIFSGVAVGDISFVVELVEARLLSSVIDNVDFHTG